MPTFGDAYCRDWLYPQPWESCIYRSGPSLGVQGGSLYNFGMCAKANALAGFTATQQAAAWNQSAINGFTFPGGGSAYVDTGIVTVTTNFSYGCWWKLISGPGSVNDRPIGNGDSSGGVYGTSIIVGYPSSTSIYVVIRNPGSHDISGTVSAVGTGWHRTIVTIGSAGSVAYDNGVSFATGTATSIVSTGALRIGMDPGGSTSSFHGAVDTPFWLNRVMSAGEVADDYCAPRGYEFTPRSQNWLFPQFSSIGKTGIRTGGSLSNVGLMLGSRL